MLLFSGGRIDITPPTPLHLAGYPKQRLSSKIADPLETNVAVLRINGRLVAFVQIDTLYVGNALRRHVTAAFENVLREEDIFFCASHTHFAPNTDERLPLLGAFDEQYVSFVGKQIVDLMREVLADNGQAVHLTYCLGTANHAVNRRAKRWVSPKATI